MSAAALWTAETSDADAPPFAVSVTNVRAAVLNALKSLWSEPSCWDDPPLIHARTWVRHDGEAAVLGFALADGLGLTLGDTVALTAAAALASTVALALAVAVTVTVGTGAACGLSCPVAWRMPPIPARAPKTISDVRNLCLQPPDLPLGAGYCGCWYGSFGWLMPVSGVDGSDQHRVPDSSLRVMITSRGDIRPSLGRCLGAFTFDRPRGMVLRLQPRGAVCQLHLCSVCARKTARTAHHHCSITRSSR
jgi:hypothetical protein